MDSQLLQAAQQWLAQDPDHETRAELAALIDAGDSVELASRFETRIGFGTAGLRGELGAGPNRMNRVLVGQAAAGIARWLRAQPEFADNPSVVIGFDGRINSDVFARDSAQIFAASGIRVVLFEDFAATPLLAFAVRHGGFSMGVMVTASHNPPRDNGYKVYLGGSNGGSQIISPVDKQIAAAIQEVADSLTFDQLPKSNDYEVGGADLIESYLFQTAQLVDVDLEREPVPTVYSAMHGVGWQFLRELFVRARLELPTVVAEQNEPDGSFPTVKFPNPEEPGAMDLTFTTGTRVGAKLAIVNDPDADRLAIAAASDEFVGSWRKFTGDEVGLLLAAEFAERAAANGHSGTLACSIASSSAIGRVATHYGLGFEQTLTGFKWIAKVPNLLFGYEEALGYCVDPFHTPDKDGISAALVIVDLAERLAAKGFTLVDRLAELGDKFGHFATGQISIRFEKVAQAQAKVSALRSQPPAMICGQLARFEDLALAGGQLPPTDALRFTLNDGSRVLIRPSGTEPKLKCYLEAVGESAQASQVALAQLEQELTQILK